MPTFIGAGSVFCCGIIALSNLSIAMRFAFKIECWDVVVRPLVELQPAPAAPNRDGTNIAWKFKVLFHIGFQSHFGPCGFLKSRFCRTNPSHQWRFFAPESAWKANAFPDASSCESCALFRAQNGWQSGEPWWTPKAARRCKLANSDYHSRWVLAPFNFTVPDNTSDVILKAWLTLNYPCGLEKVTTMLIFFCEMINAFAVPKARMKWNWRFKWRFGLLCAYVCLCFLNICLSLTCHILKSHTQKAKQCLTSLTCRDASSKVNSLLGRLNLNIMNFERLK